MSAPFMKCGATTEHQIEFTGMLVGSAFMCTPCYQSAMTRYAEHQAQFRELLASGATREEANRIMIDRIDGTKPL